VNDAPAEREAMNWWDALRRRKVVQWTVAYAAGAWVLLQVLDYAADAFGWPAAFENLSRLEGDAYFVDGIHDDILTPVSDCILREVQASDDAGVARDRLPIRKISG
jgi:hypothetical protein